MKGALTSIYCGASFAAIVMVYVAILIESALTWGILGFVLAIIPGYLAAIIFGLTWPLWTAITIAFIYLH